MSNAWSALLFLPILATSIAAAQPNRARDLPALAHEQRDEATLQRLERAAERGARRGTLAQYVGRLHRAHDAKREVIVYDYVDGRVPVLARMAAKRKVGYRALGYSIQSEP